MMKNKRAVRVPSSAKQQLETTQLRFWWQLKQTAATPFNFLFYFNGVPWSPVEVYFTNISHLKINIWEMVTILWLLLLPRILYCRRSTLQMDW